MKLQTAYDAFMRSRQAIACTESTMEAYRQELGMLSRFLEARGVSEMQGIDIPALLDYMAWTHQRGVSAATLNSYRMRMGVFVNWCGLMGYCRPDMMKAVPKARERHYIRKTHTQEEVQALLKAAADPVLLHPWDAQEMTAMLLLLLDTGLRASEACSLDVGDLDGELIKVRGKGDRDRFVRISEMTRKALEHYLGHSSLMTTDNYLRGFGYEDAARENKTFTPVGALLRH